jgi:uncharacterized damage-inducible protein DinB
MQFICSRPRPQDIIEKAFSIVINSFLGSKSMAKPGTAARIADLLERIARDAMAQFGDIRDEDFNRRLSLPESNTLCALATHLVAAGEFWVLVLVGKREIPRNRPAEFSATGRARDLLPRYERWIQDVHEVLDDFPDERLSESAEPPAGYALSPASQRERSDVRDALLHAVEHSALHLGHLQLTRQFLGYAPPADE